MELLKSVKENKGMYRKISVLVEFMVIVFIVLTQYNYWLTRPTGEMQDAQSADYNLKITARNLTKWQSEKIIDTTKFDTVQDSSIIRETGFEVVDTRYTTEFSDWSGYKNGGTDYISIYAIGKKQYDNYIEQLGLSYDGIKDKVILCEYQNVIGYKKTPITAADDNEKYMKMYDYSEGDFIRGVITRGGKKQEIQEFEVGSVAKEVPFGLKSNGVKIILSDELFEKYIDSRGISICYKSNNVGKLLGQIRQTIPFEYTVNNLEYTYNYHKSIQNAISFVLYSIIVIISLVLLLCVFIITNTYAKKNNTGNEFYSPKDIFKMKLLECTLISCKILVGAYLTSIILNGIMNTAIHTPAGVILIFIPLFVMLLYIPFRMLVGGFVAFLIKIIVELPIAIWFIYIFAKSDNPIILIHQIIVPIVLVISVMVLVATFYSMRNRKYILRLKA